MSRSPITRTTGTIAHDVTIAIPTSAADVAALQREAESDAPAIKAITVNDADEYAFADAILTDVVRKKDAIVAMRKSATVPLYGVIRTIESWFKPVVSTLEAGEASLKRAMGSWRLACADAERAAREAAAVAAESGDAGALVEALQVATAIQAAPAAGRATTRFVWAVKRIAADLVPSDWLVPDVARIEALAKATPGDGPAPVVPGVIFERVAQIGARR
jgi:hypothetical protein